MTSQFVEAYERKHLRHGKISLKFLEEELRTVFVTFPVKPHSPFFEEFKDNIQRLIDAGICPKKLNGKDQVKNPRQGKLEDEVPALVLKMEDLGIGFLVCLVPLALAAVALISELATPIVKALVISARDRLTLLHLIRIVAKMRMGQL